MKIVVLGGSSQSTPALIQFFAHVPQLPALEFVLVGRDRRSLEAVTRASRILLGEKPIVIIPIVQQEHAFPKILENANVIIIQIRVGGYEGRDFDETFPHAYGICGDEGLGPGGVSAAWRTWPELQVILRNIEVASAQPLVVLLTSPIGILVRACYNMFPTIRLVGICELPWTTLASICSLLEIAPEEIKFDYFGINHFGWFHQISTPDRDLLQEYIRKRGSDSEFPSKELMLRYGGIPTKYLRLHFHQEEVLEEQLKTLRSRGETLEDLKRVSLSVFQKGVLNDIQKALKTRPSPWYTYAVGPLILALAKRVQSIPLFLSLPNWGSFPEFTDDDILECAFTVQNMEMSKITGKTAVPRQIMELTQPFINFERLATLAVCEQNISRLQVALKEHPWIKTKHVREIAEKIVAQTL